MFLLYRNQGERRYGLQPIAPYSRRAWQFQFITEGQCSILLREGEVTREERLVGPVLSIAGPDCVHGFGGRPEDVCQATIFHLDEADFTLRSIIGRSGHRRLRFSPAELPALRALYDRCSEARRAIGTSPPEAKKRAGFFEPLIYGIVANELTLFFLRHIPRAELGPAPNFGETKVVEALAWYASNLVRSPSAADVARAVHVSPTHLRRLFHKIRSISPQTAFTRVQFERVKWLMRDSSMTLERIAESSGFGSASAFSRAFKTEFGISPKGYRETLQKNSPRLQN